MENERKDIELRSEEVQEVMGQIPAWIVRWGITLLFLVVDVYKRQSLDFSSVKDTFNLSLSSLLSSFQVIRLENSEDALTAAGQDTHIAVSDHYILVKSFRAGSSCKLYNRNGDFIRKISSQGQGPDEYNLFIYDQYLDESNNKIYLMEIRASKILVFDFDGQPQKHIPLAYICLLYTSRCV